MKITTPAQSYDVVVVGGGMVGASFAIALSKFAASHNLEVLLVEAFVPDSDAAFSPQFDARSTALSYGSSKIYERIGLWQNMCAQVTPIKEIQISDKGRFGSTRLNSQEQQVDALGYVIENKVLGSSLNSALEKSSAIQFFAPATIVDATPTPHGMQLVVNSEAGSHSISATLVVLADGGKSPMCEQLGIARTTEQYEQHALIANIAFSKPHNNVAYERFTDTGPLAVLPLAAVDQQHRGSLVWTLTAVQAEQFQGLDEAELLPILQERFGGRLGEILHIGARFIYPLSLSIAQEQIRPGIVLLGNIAHTLHPVAGQGFNLALRDVEVLATVLAQSNTDGACLGSMAVLQKYLQQRQPDQDRAIAFTDYITRLFSSNSDAKIWLRKLGLLSIDLIPPMRREFANQAMGLSVRK